MDDNPATSYNHQLKIENKTWLNGQQPGHSIVTFLYFGPILSVSKRTHLVKNKIFFWNIFIGMSLYNSIGFILDISTQVDADSVSLSKNKISGYKI